MTRMSRGISRTLVVTICLMLPGIELAGQQYPALESVGSVRAVYDLRTATPERTARYLDLIHQLLTDDGLTAISARPDFVVVVSGQAITHISDNRDGFSPAEQETLDQIADTVAAMATDGITIEACLYAAGRLGVDPESFLTGVNPVGNGWISLIGYQAKGYSLVPVY